MKKVLKIFFAILVFGCCVNKAGAVTLNVGDKAYKSPATGIKINSLSYDKDRPEYKYSLNYYYFSYNANRYDANNKTFAYCLDPQKAAFDGVHHVERVLNLSNPYDAGLLEIFKNGRNDDLWGYKGKNDEINAENFYAATNIAIRAYNSGIYGYGTHLTLQCNGKPCGQKYASAHANLGANVAIANLELAKSATGYNWTANNWKENLSNMKGYADWYNNSESVEFIAGKNTVGEEILRVAKELVEIGLKKAAEVAKNGNNLPKISQGQTSETEAEAKDEYYVYSNIKVENFADDAIIKYESVSCPNCQREGITIKGIEYKNIQNNKWERLSTGINLAKQIETKNGYKNGNIQIRLLVEKEERENCVGADYEIKYNYTDSKSASKLVNAYNGAILYAGKENSSSYNHQRFIVISKNDNIKNVDGDNLLPRTLNGKITCQGPRPCATEVSLPICSSDKNKAVATVTAPENIKRCIINNKDEAGNSYQLSDGNGGVSNPYCSVFCKEDYAKIQLNPIVENVTCGGYFQLKSHVEGKKTCYTGSTNANQEINKDQFLKDIMEAQEDMISAYDDYLKWTEASKNVTSENVNKNCGSGTFTIWKIASGTYTGYEYNSRNILTGSIVGKRVSNKTLPTYTSGTNNTTTYTTKNKTDANGNVIKDANGNPVIERVPSGCSSVTEGKKSDVTSYIDKELSKAKTALKEAYNRFMTAVQQYNGCTTAWTNTFKFDQRIKFYYDENHYIGNYTTYYDLLENAKDKDLFYLEKNGRVNENKSVEVCLGTTNDKYECNSGFKRITENSSEKLNNYNYVDAYKEVFDTNNYTLISIGDNSLQKQIPISKATFVRKTVEKKQDYITPTSYYQVDRYGRITVNKHYAGNALQLSAIKNGLPVSTKLVGGGLFRLMLEDFGEFYDSKEVGRIFDFKGDNEKKSIAYTKQENGIQTFDGNYKCNFYSNCRDERCPDCEYKCETPEDCGWRQCPDCKIYCVNCLFNLDKLQLNFKTISTTNFNSAGRNYGYNWITSSNITSLKLLTDKATHTINRIEDFNETIYDTNNKDNEDSEFEMSIKLDKGLISFIKDYNKQAEGKGGYLNNSLKCVDYTDKDGKVYEKLFCKSELLDEIFENYSGNITVKGDRDDVNSYWTPWTKMDPNATFGGDVIGGPAWK